LSQKGIVSKVRVSKKGTRSGGCRFSRGALYELLANPIYVGEIRHKQERHPGLHEPILGRELWEVVQQHLRETAARGAKAASRAIASPLAGKIFDAGGEPLYAQGAAKAGRRYRYYVSRHLVNGSHPDDGKGWRLAAPELERAAAIAARQILNDRAGLLGELQKSGIESPDLRATLEVTAAFCRRLENAAEVSACIAELVDRVELRDDGIGVTLKIQVPCSRAGARTTSLLSLIRFVPLKMKRRGVETRIIIAAGGELPRKVDPALLKAIAPARSWFEELLSGQARSLAEIARRDGLPKRYVARLSRLAFISPKIADGIVGGRAPVEISLQMLMDGRLALPLDWRDQQLTLVGQATERP
jgi:site-specific DNA recombinase